jgi:hypothetical protein
VVGLFAAVIFGGWASALPPEAGAHIFLQRWFAMGPQGVALAVAAYGFLASVLPVWLLLTPRDYLSSYLKLGTVAALMLGVIWVHPKLQAPAFSIYVHGNGPIIAGKIFPFCFITIACGAISGFHSLIATGTTSKMLRRETDARAIGYGAMICEGLVGVTCLIAASALHPADYYAINATPEVFKQLGLSTVDLSALEQAVGTQLLGKTGGAVSLAVGMAKIFADLPIVREIPRVLAYWYHFAIMFEARCPFHAARVGRTRAPAPGPPDLGARGLVDDRPRSRVLELAHLCGLGRSAGDGAALDDAGGGQPTARRHRPDHRNDLAYQPGQGSLRLGHSLAACLGSPGHDVGGVSDSHRALLADALEPRHARDGTPLHRGNQRGDALHRGDRH